MKVSFVEPAEPLPGTLLYDAAEYSFRFEPGSPVDLAERMGGSGATSLSIGTLQIEVGVASGLVLFAWGLHPRSQWRSGMLSLPNPQPGLVRVTCPEGLRHGVAIGLAEVGAWSTLHDPRSGWIQVARDSASPDGEQILVAAGTVLGLREGSIASVWLQPVFDE
jgi:hypothetical protein